MASKSLGVLTLDLVAKTSGFVQGMDQSERQSAKWRKQVEKDLQAVARVSGAAIGTAIAATAGLVVQQVRAASEITKLAQVSSAGTTEFQRYAAAADMVGVNQEKLSDQLKDFNEKVGEFQQSGGGGMKDFFEQIAPQIGITAEAFRDLSGPQALQLYYDSLEKAGLSQQQMSFYLESMASDTTALIPLLRNGGEGFRLLGDEADRAGTIMSEETLSAADKLSAATLVATNSMAGLRNTVGAQLMPVLADLAVEFSAAANEGALAEDVASTLAGTFRVLAAGAMGAFGAVQLMVKGFEGINTLTDTEAWYENIVPPLLARRIYKNWQENSAALGEVGDDLESTFERYKTLTANLFEEGATGGGDGSSLIERLAKFRDEMRKIESGNTGGGLGVISEEAKKAQEAIAKEITALERAATTWGMTADEVKLYTLAQQGATDAQQLQAATALRVVESLDAQAEAHKRVREEQGRINSEAMGIAESLLTEEESILASYDRRRQIILDNTKITGEAQTELLRRLEEDRNEQLLEVNGSYWERWLAGAEEALTSFDELAGTVVEQFSGRVGDAFEAMVFDAQTLDEAVANLAEGMMRSIVNALGQMAAQWLAYQAVQLIVGKTTQASAVAQTTGNAYAGVMQAGISAFASTAAIPIVGPVLAPAAMTAAIAATTPMAAAATTFAMMGMAHEGIDSIPKTGTWLLEKGERVTTAETSAKLDATLSRVNQNMEGGGSGAPPVVNIIEDASKAGQRRSYVDDQGRQALDVWIADFMGEGRTFQAVSRKIGARAVGK